MKELLSEISDNTAGVTAFSTLIQSQAHKNPTLQFWYQFIFEDCLAYIGLFLAIRTGDWNLRLASIKLMAPLFIAFDRPKYAKLIPQHLEDMLSIPETILRHIQQGGFTVSILGRPCHSIAIDEAHEMCINRECKNSSQTICRLYQSHSSVSIHTSNCNDQP